MASPIRFLRPTLTLAHLTGSASHKSLTLPAMIPRFRALHVNLRPSFCCRSGGESSIGTVAIESRTEEKELEEPRKGGRACVHLRLDAQVKFGERVAVVGSCKELGSWREPVPMEWADNAWVCELDLQGGEDIEFKFVVQAAGGKGMVWEDGGNRLLAVPGAGAYDLVCVWNSTGEAMDLLARAREEVREDEENAVESNLDDLWVAAVAKTGPFLSSVSDVVKVESGDVGSGDGSNDVNGGAIVSSSAGGSGAAKTI